MQLNADWKNNGPWIPYQVDHIYLSISALKHLIKFKVSAI